LVEVRTILLQRQTEFADGSAQTSLILKYIGVPEGKPENLALTTERIVDNSTTAPYCPERGR
jgi:hypothetical protein